MKPLNHRLESTSRWLVALGCALTLNIATADFPSGEDVLNSLGVPQDQRSDLEQGKAISYPLKEKTDEELADGIAVYVSVPLPKAIAYIKKGNFAGVDSTVTATGNIPDNATADAFKGFKLSGDEAQDLLNVEAGSKFNFSGDEIASIANLKTSLTSADDKAVAQAVSQRYREILLQRYQAYRQQGLAGIAPYTRGSDQSDPASELRTATVQGTQVLQKYSPELYQAWLNYPQSLPDGTSEKFSWANRVVEDRPTATLTHRFVQTSDSGAVVLMRQFYVGHSYNSSQLLMGCLPYHDGAIIFYALRSSTDQVAGFGSDMKHSIGRDRMKAEMIKQLQRVSNNLK